jgi:3-oxoacyl-[acyl-carrier-protein] synthase-3
MYARITGIGSYLPGEPVTNRHLIARGIDTTDDWIVERTGIRQRYLAPEAVTTHELALAASRAAIADAGIDAEKIDLIVLATSTPDYIFPSTACLMQEKLGIAGAAAFDLQAVCTGFVYAMVVAEKFIRSGSHRCALVIGAEEFSRILDWTDRTTCVLFGDGAGAVILEASDEPGILATALHADGSYHGMLSVPGNVAGGRVTGAPFLRMDGQAVFKFAVKALGDAALEVVQAAGMAREDVDWLVPHQANVRILQATARRLGLPPQKVVSTVAEHGNTSAASIPLALDVIKKDGRLRRGDTVLLDGVGGGFTWGAVLLRY